MVLLIGRPVKNAGGYCRHVSVNLVATLGKPVTLAGVIDQGRRVVSDLLGGVTVPDLAVFVDRQYQRGVRTDPGHRSETQRLAGERFAGPLAR